MPIKPIKSKPRDRSSQVKYSKKFAQFLCSKIESGMNTAEICRKYPDKVPTYPTIWAWRRKYPEFSSMLTSAYESYIMTRMDELDTLSATPLPQTDDKLALLAHDKDKRNRMDALKFTIAKTAAILNRRFDMRQVVEHKGKTNDSPQVVIHSWADSPTTDDTTSKPK